MKGVLALLAGRALERTAHYLGAERPRDDLPVTWRIGNHVLEDGDRNFLLTHRSVIMGETAVWSLDSMSPDATRDEARGSTLERLWGLTEWLKTTAGGAEMFRAHHNALVDTRDHGSVLVVTDGSFDSSVPGGVFDQEMGPMNTAKLVAILGTVGFFPSFRLLKRFERYRRAHGGKERKDDRLLMDKVENQIVTLLRVPLVASLVEETLGRTMLQQYKSSTNIGIEGIFRLIDALTGLLGEKGFVLVDATTYAADASMALNSRTIQELLRQNPKLKDRLSSNGTVPLGVYFYAGGAHDNAKDVYESRMEYTAGRLGTIADRLIDYYVEELTKGASQPQVVNTQEELLHSWTFLTSRFGYPIPSFSGLPEFQSAPKLDLPDSPRAILYKQLLRRIANESRTVNEGERKGEHVQRYWALFNRLAQEDMKFNSVYERHVTPLRERAIRYRDQAELSLPFQGADLVFFEGIPHWIPSSS